MTAPLEPHGPRPNYPVEAKVKASTAAATATTFVLWLLGTYVFRSGSVPEFVVSFVESLVAALVSGVVTFVSGWLARHTPR
jgi:hypothetical protein